MTDCDDLEDCLLFVGMISYLRSHSLLIGQKMSISTKCQVLEVGKVRRDAGAFFGELPFDDWNKNFINGSKEDDRVPESMHIGRDRRAVLPANVLLIQTESDRILIDTGTPAVHEDQAAEDWSGSKLRQQLKTVSTGLKDISKVVLTSFDIDHAGGLTHLNRSGELVYAFPHAEISSFVRYAGVLSVTGIRSSRFVGIPWNLKYRKKAATSNPMVAGANPESSLVRM